jgi:phage FluMu gp28-like protein
LIEILPANEGLALKCWLSQFYPFQREWVTDPRLLGALVKCRQIGGSFSFGGFATLNGAFFGESTVLVSRAEPEAIDLLQVARKHAIALHEMGSEWAKIVSPPNQLSFKMASGAEIRATTSKAAGRGFSGNVVLDEFAYHDRPDEVWDAALAATTHGYKCRILSTPNGVGDLFHQLCTELAKEEPSSPAGWKLYKTTIHDAIRDGMDIDMAKAWEMARNDPRVFAQLFECSFIDGDLQYLPHDMIMRASTGIIPNGSQSRTFGGIDIGESRDKTVLSIIQGTRDGYGVKHIEVHGRTDDILIANLIDQAYNVHKCARVAIDATGMGTFPVQAAQRKFPALEAIWFTNQVKEELATRLYQALSSGKLALPKPSPGSQLHDDLASIKRLVTSAGNVRFDAPRTSKGHADTAWALMLALHATEYGEAAGAYTRLKGLRSTRAS